MFGLAWGDNPDRVKARFARLAPGTERADTLVWPLDLIVDRLTAEDAFVPTALGAAPGGTGHEVTFRFAGGALAAIAVAFGYPFETVGQDPDRLSEQAMAAIARAEATQLLHEMAVRYGLPGLVTEGPMRDGSLHIVLAAHYVLPDGTAIALSFGHDVGALAGRLRYLAPAERSVGL